MDLVIAQLTAAWLLFLLFALLTLVTADKSTPVFRLHPNGLEDEVRTRSDQPIMFDPSWVFGEEARALAASTHLPRSLPVPTFVRVYDCTDAAAENDDRDDCLSLSQLGRVARNIVDADLPEHGAVLFRGLQHRIHSARDFSSFWQGCCGCGCDVGGDADGWTPMEYVTFGADRPKLDGVDLSISSPPQYALPCHNELSYNPRPPSRIAFYCLQDAIEGGETLLAKNTDVTECIRSDIKDFVWQNQGIVYIREYPDQKHVDHEDDRSSNFTTQPQMSWQRKCKTEDRNEAISFFENLGFARSDTSFDANGKMTVTFAHSGFIQDDQSGRDVWFNGLEFGLPTLADGSAFPSALAAQIQLDKWIPVCAFRMHPGDWLVLNNRAVQHGRLPYKEAVEAPRRLLTVYTK